MSWKWMPKLHTINSTTPGGACSGSCKPHLNGNLSYCTEQATGAHVWQDTRKWVQMSPDREALTIAVLVIEMRLLCMRKERG